MVRQDGAERPGAVAETADPAPIIPNITEGDAAALAEAELQSTEDLDILRNAIPREFHPKAIKKEYRLKAILWSVLLAAVIVSGMIGDRNKWGSMVNNVLRMMSGQATETTGVPDQIPTTSAQEQNPDATAIAPSYVTPLPPLTEVTPLPGDTTTPEVIQKNEPYNNLIIENEFDPVEVNGVLVHPNGLGPRKVTFSTGVHENMLTIIIKSKDPETPEEGGIFSVADTRWVTEGLDDSNVIMVGQDLGDGSFGYDIPINTVKGTTFYNLLKRRGDAFVTGTGLFQIIDPDTGNEVLGQPPAGKYYGIHFLKPKSSLAPAQNHDTLARSRQSLAELAAVTRARTQRQMGTGIF